MEQKITFRLAKKDDDLKSIFDHNIDVFSDSPDFAWTFDDLKHEMKKGWGIYSVETEGVIIAAAFIKQEKGELLTKNTAIKSEFQGSGFSHRIKEFFEAKAQEFNVKKIKHFCRIDNFRQYSLNESHGYEKMGPLKDEDHIVEWVKPL